MVLRAGQLPLGRGQSGYRLHIYGLVPFLFYDPYVPEDEMLDVIASVILLV